jgi:cholesterol oxidase
MSETRGRREFLEAGVVAAVGAAAEGCATRTPPAVLRDGPDYDTVVVGSGFGGAVVACRLAEAGQKVLVLERGRRWQSRHHPRSGATSFPRRRGDPFLWNQDEPHSESGWFDVRLFPGMIVLVAAGVGGGSLAYSNVSVEPAPDSFVEGWPREIRYEDLQEHLTTVGKMLGVEKVPPKQLTERFKLLREGARALGYEDRFRALDLAVSFDYDFVPEPLEGGRARVVENAKRFRNPFGVEQGRCVHLGTCNIGCDAQARNSLDLNYLARAESQGAEIRPLHLVRFLVPAVGGGYVAHYDRILPDERRLERGSVSARRVVLASGSLGSTELLLRCRDEFGSLPRLSRELGRHWSSNANFLTPAVHPGRRVSPTHGPTISGAIDFNERPYEGESIHMEDGGFPDVLGTWLRDNQARDFRDALVDLAMSLVRDQLREADADGDRSDPYRYLMPWFAQGRDCGEGRMRLKRSFWVFGPRRLHLDWDLEPSRRTFEKIVDLHTRLARATGGEPKLSPLWTALGSLATPHPLGGCAMADAPGEGRTWTDARGRARRTDQGVVDHRGAVFGYPGLYVADGAIFPRSIGRNPSRTIAALAERVAAGIIAAGKA